MVQKKKTTEKGRATEDWEGKRDEPIDLPTTGMINVFFTFGGGAAAALAMVRMAVSRRIARTPVARDMF